MKNQKVYLLTITVPYIVVLLIVIPIVSCFVGMMHTFKTAADSVMEAADVLITEYKKAWRKPKEPENNMWDDEDTWGAQ